MATRALEPQKATQAAPTVDDWKDDFVDVQRERGTKPLWLASQIEILERHIIPSYAMDFAPSGQMPTTRRAPYLGLALWAGKRANPFFSLGRVGTINLAHAPHALEKASHDGVWSESERATRALLAEPPDDARWLRDVAFCLPEAWLADQ